MRVFMLTDDPLCFYKWCPQLDSNQHNPVTVLRLGNEAGMRASDGILKAYTVSPIKIQVRI